MGQNCLGEGFFCADFCSSKIRQVPPNSLSVFVENFRGFLRVFMSVVNSIDVCEERHHKMRGRVSDLLSTDPAPVKASSQWCRRQVNVHCRRSLQVLIIDIRMYLRGCRIYTGNQSLSCFQPIIYGLIVRESGVCNLTFFLQPVDNYKRLNVLFI